MTEEETPISAPSLEEKTADEVTQTVVPVAEDDLEKRQVELFPVPKPYNLGVFRIPNYYSTVGQVFLAGLVNFLSVGMFLVLISLGGSGQLDPTTADNSNTILYCVFAVTAFFSGSLTNFFGPRIMLSIGALGYATYGAAFWSYDNDYNKGFVLFGGAACGFGAGTLWASTGSILLSYPTEAQKGRFLAMFLSMSYAGSVIGGIIPTVENYHNTAAGSVSNGTYAAVTILMVISCGLALLIVSPDKIIRTDGTRVLVKRSLPLKEEIKNIYYSFKKEKLFVFFLPYAFTALYYPPYQSNDFNAYFFNVRTRAINGLLYGFSQMMGSIIFGLLMDLRYFKRRTRAIYGWAINFITIFVVSLCGYFPAKESQRGVPYNPPMDFTDGPKAAAYMTLYFFYGWQDATVGTYAFWLLGALSNDPKTLSMYTAFYKVMGSIAAAVAFGTDGDKVPYMGMFGSYWAVELFGVLFVTPLVFKRVTNTSEEEAEPPTSIDQYKS